MNFATNAEEMLNKDPHAIAMLEECLIRMPNQNLTEKDARSIVEFMRKNDGQKCNFKINDFATLPSIVFKGDIGLAESYRDGKWESDNLVSLLQFGLENEKSLSGYIYGTGFYMAIARLIYRFKENSIKGSKKNIHAHYDLGNDFYSLWLDETMTYSSALFNEVNDDLANAQNNKYDRILQRIQKTSQEILEIGCGWGGFSERAIKQKDHKVKGITISNSQYEYATKRLANMQSNANIVIEDYRLQQGKFDNIVSIEMFEAVGEKYWSIYFEKIASLLKSKGKAIVQTITIKDEFFESYKKGGDLIRSFIFPGGMLPSPKRFEYEAKKAGLKITDQYFFGHDYSKTLSTWLEKFESQKRNVKALGFDEKFIRIWRMYLASCIASFNISRTNVMQVELENA
jgi:cyclopropane-fatty-acyl-phospholipid synthase